MFGDNHHTAARGLLRLVVDTSSVLASFFSIAHSFANTLGFKANANDHFCYAFLRRCHQKCRFVLEEALHGWPFFIAHHLPIIITCSEMPHFPKSSFPSLLQKLPSGVLRRLSKPCISVYQLGIVGYLYPRVFGSAGLSRCCFSLGFNTKNTEVHFHKSYHPKMFIFTSHTHPVHRVVSHKAVEVTCAFSSRF